jgi:hypothetical protein
MERRVRDHPASATPEVGSAGEQYRSLFEQRASERIAVKETFWKQPIFADDIVKPLVAHHISALNNIRAHARTIAIEAASFLSQIDDARYREQLDEIDLDLARRERILLKILIASLMENRNLVRLNRLSGRVVDFKRAILRGQTASSKRAFQQVMGEKGYLTEPPDKIRKSKVFQKYRKGTARAISRAASSTRKNLLAALLRFLPRYVLDIIRRNLFYVIIGCGVFVFGPEVVIHYKKWHNWTLRLVIFLMVVYLADRIVDRFLENWRNRMHRKQLTVATRSVYLSLIDFIVESAALNSLHQFVTMERGGRE